MNEEIHVYCMPGMAANSKIFEHIRLPKPYVIHLLDWIDPQKNESLQSYASRLCEEITQQPCANWCFLRRNYRSGDEQNNFL